MGKIRGLFSQELAEITEVRLDTRIPNDRGTQKDDELGLDEAAMSVLE